MKDGDVLVFENTRFEDVDGKKESGNDAELGKYWASLGDVFVNDAFGTAHRAHASNVGIASTGIPTVAGFLMEKEIKFIGEAVENPKRPFVAILGGAKVSDKIAVIENLIEKADKILIGGGMAYTFMKEEGLDIGEKTIELFANELQGAKTVVWNGPMGVFEMSNFAKGTIGVCEAIANLEDATTIIGGGDSAAAAIQLGYENKFSHISTGGGASLELLEGKTLPGLASINDK